MAPLGSLLLAMLVLSLLSCTSLATPASHQKLLISTISAAPATLPGIAPQSSPSTTISAAPSLLPSSPLSPSPALSPDITPLLPSPGSEAAAPDASMLPIIPSSPSPPNPDEMLAPGPNGLASRSLAKGCEFVCWSSPLFVSSIVLGVASRCVRQKSQSAPNSRFALYNSQYLLLSHNSFFLVNEVCMAQM
ncbi:hypothetical protein EUGRSUZ_K03437 [Eucalyptus grandis]|uniref:Uncharacterized protein n=2 Tax=Eucalyptus grandis TaxID=71139 RepID=A0ACC3J135_EUCGR|nr:hypothetical protein EUGRSUZ_K03437 [Eucalyptus grandis]